MNSTLQCLNAVPELVLYFTNDGTWHRNASVAPAYSDLLVNVWSKHIGDVVSPSTLLRQLAKQDLRWGDGSQQDSQEFLHFLLEALQNDCNCVEGKPQYRQLEGKGSEEAQALEALTYERSWHNSVVDDIFGGFLQSTTECSVCKRKSHCFDPILDLAVPIPALKGSVSVQDCLQSFVETERLDGSDSVRCEACKKRTPHSKRLQIYSPPRVLVLTLKRFSSRANGGIFSRFRSTSKNSTSVLVEAELDLAPYCNRLGIRGHSSVRYQLVAISQHSGSLEGGHYTAAARSCSDGAWYSFNDSSVRRDTKPVGPSGTAYVLFYRMLPDQDYKPASNL